MTAAVTEQRPAVRVVGLRRLSETFVRAEIEGDGLTRLDLPGVPDEACVFHFPLADGGRDEYGRWYTLREVSSCGTRASIDLVCHAGGIGADWARRARVGDELEVSRSHSWFRRPAGARWQILVGDAAAVPALARVVAETPAGIDTEVVLEVDEIPADFPGGVRIRHEPAPGHTSRLAEIVAGLELPDGPGYVYIGGEAAATRTARKHLRHERGLPATAYGVLGYWRRDADTFRRRWAENRERYERAYSAAETAGAGDEEKTLDLYEAALARDGLL
ncbi:siderophore-interacting protein [Pseudonocardia parietis]|uniref:NADPH-dependent ferric siderophore reductase n=1 Tax=Pseudonocardia parietis TaxID=570936 RepID=A0ABS4W426_9PSEU|nr:siderophore-interacting protein [Pseudonocardia parietis]MBP2370949.1 NADPH-dependent ferric siderophore reductase [Pseudonocardia parietis]